MNTPKDRKYTKTHEWVKQEDDRVIIGISDYAQHALGDLVFADLPQAGDKIAIGDVFAELESVKAVSGIYSPVSGEIVAVNDELADEAGKINADPYGAWLVEVSAEAFGELMDAAAYDALCEKEGA